jgi:acyl carrier protein
LSTDHDVTGQGETLAVLERCYQQTRRIARDLRPGDNLRSDLKLDSLGALELLTRLEAELGVELINRPGVLTVQTVGDLLGELDAARHAAPGAAGQHHT